MADRLTRLKGRFLLSLNDHPEVRRIFARFTVEAVPTTYSIAGGDKALKLTELVISP